MTVSDRYTSQVELLLHCFPAISEAPYFALKGGTAINLFYRNMPRISVDIDLVYLPINKRETALSEIQSGITIIAETIRETNKMVQIRFSKISFSLFRKRHRSKLKLTVLYAVACLLRVRANYALQLKKNMKALFRFSGWLSQNCTGANFALLWTVSILGICLTLC